MATQHAGLQPSECTKGRRAIERPVAFTLAAWHQQAGGGPSTMPTRSPDATSWCAASICGDNHVRGIPSESKSILFRTRGHMDLSVICERHMNHAGVTAHRAVFHVFLIRSSCRINGNHDLFATYIADVACFVVHCPDSITSITANGRLTQHPVVGH